MSVLPGTGAGASPDRAPGESRASPPLDVTRHRPWPLPGGRWSMRMVWCDLAFLHWPVPASAVRPLVPPGLELDLFDGWAWIGVVPFRMEGVRMRPFPPIPGTDAFPELNVRTYVRAGGRTGVWFFSLDATSRLAVRAARLWHHLPYYNAAIHTGWAGDVVPYHSRRTHRGAPAAEFAGRYRALGPPAAPAPGSLEHWLVERYCLFAADRDGRIGAVDVHHHPWPLQPAEAEVERNSMAAAADIPLPARPPLVHFARRLEVLAWPRVRIATG